MNTHKNQAIVAAVTQGRMTVSGAARHFNVSRQWIYELLKRVELEGPEGTVARSRAPHSRPGTTNPVIKQRIIDLRLLYVAQGKDAGPDSLAFALRAEGFTAPSTSTIRRILHSAGLITPEPRKRPRRSYIRFEAQLPNECWQADITYWQLLDGTRVEILDFLDDYSRYLIHIHAQAFYTGTQVGATLDKLINEYGPPASTLTDNGLVFTSRFTSRPGALNAFEKTLATHHIKQKNGRPGHPQTQGKIERFHQTLKKYLRATPPPETIEELNTRLATFRSWYNNDRPHRARANHTPAQAYTSRLPKATPDTETTSEYRTRHDRVDNSGKVSLRYAGKLRHLGIGRPHAGTLVTLIIENDHVITIETETGIIIAEHTIDPERTYQPKTQ